MREIRIDNKLLSKALQRRNEPFVDTKKAWQKCRGRIGVDSVEENLGKGIHVSGKSNMRQIVFALLATAAVFVVVFFIWNNALNEQKEPLALYTKQDNPQKCIVVSEAGKTLAQKGQLADYSAKKVNTTTPQKVVVSTPHSGDTFLTLPDGTKVWLNNLSEISFPDRFVGDTRLVELKGEAYFEVTHDANKPFMVKSDRMTTTVLGTSFDMNVRGSNPFVVLVEGKITAGNNDNSRSLNVIPGEKAIVDKDGNIKSQKVDASSYVQWRNGLFYYDDETLRNIMCEIGRWFNVSIVVENNDILDAKFHFVAERSDNLAEIVGNLNSIGGLNVVVEDGNLVIK